MDSLSEPLDQNIAGVLLDSLRLVTIAFPVTCSSASAERRSLNFRHLHI
jgi:hypothetical protein